MAQSIPGTQDAPNSGETSNVKPHNRLRTVIPFVLLAAVAGGTVWYFLSRPNENLIRLSGRIEGYPTDIGAKVGGRVNSVAVREGDRVNPNQVVVELDDAEIQAQLRGAEARLLAAQQQEKQALFQISVVENQIREAQLGVQQATGDASGRIYQAQSNVATAEAQLGQSQAQLEQSQSELNLARVNRDRFAQLWQTGVISRQQFDQAQTSYETARAAVGSRAAAVTAAQRQVNAAEGALTQVQTTSLNPEIRTAQVDALLRQLDVAKAQLDAAQAEVKNAQAARQQIQAQLAYLKVSSPLNGVVLTRTVEPGQVVAAGKTLITVIDPGLIYLRGYIPEGQIGNVRVGQRAQVFLDSAPKKPLEAEVSAIDTQAAFTPENIYFREDRVRQVFGVRLTIKDPRGFAKPGMPADGEIKLNQ